MYRFDQYAKESFESLKVNPLRSSLSIIGVIFGVASVVAMLGIGLGAQKEVESLIASLGAQNIHITANDLDDENWRQVISFSIGLSRRDQSVIKELFPMMESTGISKWTSSDINRPLKEPKLNIFGVDPSYPNVITTRLVAGRFFTATENELAFPVAVIGNDLAEQWFQADPKKALNQEIRISRAWFRVIGVLAKSSSKKKEEKKETAEKKSTSNTPPSSAMNSKGEQEGLEIKQLNLDDALILPMNSAISRLGSRPMLSALERIVVKVPTHLDPIGVKESLKSGLEILHRRAKVLTVTAADEIIQQKKATAQLFTFFLLTIALISLVVGGIGIANVMLASMVERIGEVGLRRAIGAKRRHILFQFLSEAVFICILGGLVGGFLGIFVAGMVGFMTDWTIEIPWWGLIIAILISTIVGIVSGLFPALQASRISPIEALQRRA